MGFPMTVERVVSRNHLDRDNAALMDDLRRLAEDSATLAIAASEALPPDSRCDEWPYCGHLTPCQTRLTASVPDCGVPACGRYESGRVEHVPPCRLAV